MLFELIFLNAAAPIPTLPQECHNRLPSMTPYEENELLKLEKANRELQQQIEMQEKVFGEQLESRFQAESLKRNQEFSSAYMLVSKRIFYTTVLSIAIIVLVVGILSERQSELAKAVAGTNANLEQNGSKIDAVENQLRSLKDSSSTYVKFGDAMTLQSTNLSNGYVRHSNYWLRVDPNEAGSKSWSGDTQFLIKRGGDYK